jgi:phage shock protein PspC (stress-responsive transcriptional regulator)
VKKIGADWLRKRFPQNFIIRNPLAGSLIIAVFCFGFLILYRPLNSHEGYNLTYTETMALYSFLAGAFLYGFILLIKRIRWFADDQKWTLPRELSAILLMMIGLGIAVYFLAFLIEPPADRWNLATFVNSLVRSFMVFILPVAFFFALNVHQYLTQPVILPGATDTHATEPEEQKIPIQSKLKKEKLSFYPSEFLYAESEGNYVVFHLFREGKEVKKTIRNSISNLEQQLSEFPYLVRTHRAFLINLKQVTRKEGNVSGYQLTLDHTGSKLPVSRKRAGSFETLFERYHH